ELPAARRSRFVEQYAISEYDSVVLTTTRALADFFEETVRICKQPKTAANRIMGDLLRCYKEDARVDIKDLSESRVSSKKLADLILYVDAGRITGKMAKS